jgi:hypothetical protein
MEQGRERRLAASALLYEVELNLEWSRHLTHDGLGPLLRDEAHVRMKNRGSIGDLPEDAREQLILAYEALYRVNEATTRLQSGSSTPTPTSYAELAEEFRRICGPLHEKLTVLK